MSLPDWLTPVVPDAPSPRVREADGGGLVGGGTQLRRGGPENWTPERVAQAEEDNLKHRAWLASEAGRAWLNAQPWAASIPVVRVRQLGLQQHPNGTSMMLYNRLDDGSTVTLDSLVKQGVRIEVVG